MVTLKLDPKQATLGQVRKKLELQPHEVDETFGVVNVSPKDNLYAILVDDAVAERLQKTGEIAGAFSDPRIEPFGTPLGPRRGEPR